MPIFSDADNLAYMRSQAAIINREAVELDYNTLYQALIPVSTEGHLRASRGIWQRNQV